MVVTTMMKRRVKRMNRRLELREVNNKTIEVLATALKRLRADKKMKEFSAIDISKLTDGYVLATTIERSVENDSPYAKKRLTLIGKALEQAFPNEKVRVKRCRYGYKEEKITYVAEDGETFETTKYFHVYQFECKE